MTVASAIAKCRHKCCWTCWNAIFKNNSDGRRGLPVSDASCPVCRTMLYYSDISDIASLSNASDASTIAFEDSKFIATLKLIRHHRDSRIIVASNWIHPLLALKEKLFKDLGITPLMISGKVPLVDRLDILNTFQNSARALITVSSCCLCPPAQRVSTSYPLTSSLISTSLGISLDSTIR